jgi:hypothetical protein
MELNNSKWTSGLDKSKCETNGFDKSKIALGVKPMA